MNPPSTQLTQNDPTQFTKNFERLKEALLSRKPVLAEIIAKSGKKTLYDYALDYIDVNLNPPIKKRQDQLLTAFKQQLQNALGEEIATKATAQLAKYYYVSTADHLGPVGEPSFLNTNLMAAAPYNEYPDPLLKYFIIFACTNVSFDTPSFPRGLIFHSAAGEGKMQKVGFFPASIHARTVFNYRAYTKKDIDRLKGVLKENVLSGKTLAKEAETIIKLIEDIYLKPEVLECKIFSEQVTKTNYHLWKRFFRNIKGVPDLVFLSQESLVIQLILEHHLTEDTTINRVLFNPAYHRSIDTNFDGIMGAFNKKKKTGTYLFWALPKNKKYRVQLWRQGNKLVSDDGSYSLELTPEAVRTALEKREIMPNTMLDFIVLAFYYGLKCLGGPNQVNYLTFMKNAYLKTMVEQGDYKSIEVAARVQTKELCSDLTLAFLKNKKGELLLATGLDLILHGTEKTWPQLVNLSKNMTLEQSFSARLPDMYRENYLQETRDPALSSVTANQIIDSFEGAKIEPCIELKTE